MNDRATEDGPIAGEIPTEKSMTPSAAPPRWEGYDLEVLNAILDPHHHPAAARADADAVLLAGAGDDLILGAPGLVAGFATSPSASGG